MPTVHVIAARDRYRAAIKDICKLLERGPPKDRASLRRSLHTATTLVRELRPQKEPQP